MKPSKKVLLIGTSFSAVPLYFKLKEQGYSVAVCGGLEHDPCHAYSDYSYKIDYSKKENLLELVQKEQFDYLVPSCNDFSYMSCAWVAQQCGGFSGYDAYETSTILHAKNKFREFTEKHGFPVPKAVNVTSQTDAQELHLKFPVLVKPSDSFSGKGITKVFHQKDIPDAIAEALKNSRNAEAVIEEFIEGTLHSHSAFIGNGEIVFDVFVDEFCSVYPYQVDCSCLTTSLADELQSRVQQSITKLVKLLELNDGLLHTQFIVEGGDFWLIEPMRRCPGDLYGKMITLSTGVDYADLFIKPFLNEPMPASVEKPHHKYIARHTISVPKPLIFTSFSHTIEAKTVQIVPLKNSGEVLEKAPYDKLGIVFAEFSTETELAANVHRLAECIHIETIGE